MKNAGVKGQKMVFLLTDAQIKDEAFLEDVDSILNTGEVPNIFAVDEKQEIMEVRYRQSKCKNYKTLYSCVVLYCRLYCKKYFISVGSSLCPLQAVRPIAQAGNKNLDFSPLALFAYFVTRCRENLHIVVAFSPIGDAFRNRLRQFPSLINCCTIDWFQVRLAGPGKRWLSILVIMVGKTKNLFFVML